MFPFATLISNLTSSNGDEERRKELDRARAEQIMRMREEERKRNELENARSRAIEILKQADQFIKNDELENAEREIERARSIDPDNIYIEAFEERIALLKHHQHHNNGNGVKTMSAQATVTQASSPDAKRIAARLIFQQVDQSIAARDIERAEAQFKRATELDPFHLAITGYRQRLDNLKRELGTKQHQQEKRQHALEEQARHKAAEEARAKQYEEVLQKVRAIREHVGNLIVRRAWDEALAEVEQGKTFAPHNKELLSLEERLLYLQEEENRSRRIEEAKQRSKQQPQQEIVSEAQQTLSALADAKTTGVERLIKHIEQLIEIKAWDDALQEIARVKQIAPANATVHTFERLLTLLKQEEEQHRTEYLAQQRTTTEQDVSTIEMAATKQGGDMETALSEKKMKPEPGSYHQSVVNGLWHRAYTQCLKQAWLDGLLSNEEEQMLSILRSSFDISERDHQRMQQEVQWEVYLEALVRAWFNGAITPAESERLDILREKLHISGDVHLRLERSVRQELLKRDGDAKKVLDEIGETYAPFFQKHVLNLH